MAELIREERYECEAPAGLNIYRLRRPSVSEAALRELAGRFGLKGTVEAGTFVHNARGIAYSEGADWGLRLLAQSGGWQYRHQTRWQGVHETADLRVNDDELAELGRRALTGFAIAGERELDLTGVQRLRVAHAQRGGENHSERVVGARVLFRRVLDGLPSEGPGGRTVVYLDHQRELSGIDHLWREIDRIHEPVSELRSTEDALEEVARRYAPVEGRVEVKELRLGYYEAGWDNAQEYLQPAYLARLELRSPDDRFRINASAAVPAARNSPGPVESRRATERQEPRTG